MIELLSVAGFPPPRVDRAMAEKLVRRIDAVRLFAHPYTFVHNMAHGGFRPLDVAEFAYQHELAGLSMHVNDGGARSLGRMSAGELAAFRRDVEALGLALHLEVSSTTRSEVDRVVALAGALGVRNVRVYSRYGWSGPTRTSVTCASRRWRTTSTSTSSSTRSTKPARSPSYCSGWAIRGSARCSTSATCSMPARSRWTR
jgi:hypothetical protein